MREFTVLTYGAMTDGVAPEVRADLDAVIDGRELPSVARAKAQKIAERKRAAADLVLAAKRL